MTKKRRVPEVLWRIYKSRARTLADTVISLLPQSPSSSLECRCKGRRCLGCSGTEAFSFLLRPDDPSDYRRLLLHCFVVVSENAPSITVFYPACRWSQQEELLRMYQIHCDDFYTGEVFAAKTSMDKELRLIVTRTIEMMCGSRMSANALFNGYSKITQSSSVVDLLTTSVWNLLLKRIGDDVMVHLLKFTSIFVPLPRENHIQVAGFPISDLCPKFSKHVSGSAHRQPLSIQSGPYKKRKITDNEDTSELEIIRAQPHLGSNSTLSSVTRNVGYNHRNCNSQQHLWNHSPNTCTKSEVCSGSRVMVQTKPKKRLKPFSWQRRRKRKQANHAEYTVLTSCISTDNDNKYLTGKLQDKSDISLSTTNNMELLHLESETQHKLAVHSTMANTLAAQLSPAVLPMHNIQKA